MARPRPPEDKKLANTKSAQKQVRQNERLRARNRWFESRARTFIKKTQKAIDAGDVDAARLAFHDAQSALDTAAEKGIIHKNNAARRKSRLAKRLKLAESGQITPVTTRRGASGARPRA